jgi:hypothetical protein
MKAIFEIREDDNGITGLMFQGAPSHFDAVDLSRGEKSRFNPANLIVHDLLEHNFNKDSGSVEDELKAIGGAMYGRGNHGDVEVRGFYSDMLSMARDSNLILRNTNKGMKKFEPVEWIIEELLNSNLINDIKFEVDEEAETSRIRKFITLAIRYIRQGARRAHKRFKNSFDMYNMFIKMSNKVLEKGRYVDYGEQLIIEFCFKKLSFNVYTKYMLDNDY